jgi:hypothetical protein
MRLKFLSFSNLTLLVALSLSSVAAYYSIIGLTAIFAGAVIPVIIMGSILEVGKITTTVWLRKYWNRAGWVIKLYLVPAVIALALLTSMGIFGFLSKAHMDSGIISGDAVAKVAIFDEKIKTAKDNIDANRKVLKQMDESVDQIMGRSTSETGADKAVAVRKSQQKERARIIAEIQAEQTTISKLSEERAPLAAEVRKVEAEVGPIKYIAALIYGDNADNNMLEAAVRWMIILLVVVFDPLAIALVLAANQSKEWDKEEPEPEPEPEKKPDYEPDEGPLTEVQIEQVKESAMKFVDLGEHPKDHDEKAVEEIIIEEQLPEPDPVVYDISKSIPILDLHPYLNNGFSHFENLTPMVYKPEVKVNEPEIKEKPKKKRSPLMMTAKSKSNIVIEEPIIEEPVIEEPEIDNSMTVTPTTPFKDLPGGYAVYEGKHMSKDALFNMHPELKLVADNIKPVSSGFGSKFPTDGSKGDVFTRVDVLPNKVFKFDGKNWIEINKESSNTYLYNTKYLEYLIDSIATGQYDPELLSENEKSQIEDHLKIQKINQNR